MSKNIEKKGVDNMVYDTNSINLTLLNQYSSTLKEEKRNFLNNVVNFSNLKGFKEIDDPYLQKILSNLDVLFKKIELSYASIIDYLVSYIENANNLELSLSDNKTSYSIPDDTIKNFVTANLQDLPKI